MTHVLDSLERGTPAVQEGALSLLYKVAEEHAAALDARVAVLGGAAPANLLMPQVAALLASPSADVRHAALRALNALGQSMPDWLVDHVAAYAESLLRLALENGEARLQKVGRGLGTRVEHRGTFRVGGGEGNGAASAGDGG